jgi:carbon-monoxide dehydrogenase medium subunit
MMKYTYVKRLPKFDYLKPATLDEALALCSQHNGEARIIAGGSDLLIRMKKREQIPQYLIGLKDIPDLDYIEYDKTKGLRFGPMVTIHAMETSSVVRDKFPILSQAASTMASAQIRNIGTVVGNLCSAVPSADMAPGLIVLGAKLKIASAKGERTLAVNNLFASPSQSALAPDELVAEVQVPNPLPNSGMVYIKHTHRSAMELAIVGVGVLLVLQEGTCNKVKICLGAVAPTPIRATKAESLLEGKTFSVELVKQVAEMAAKEARPISDIRATAEYRREMVRVLTQRALNQAKEGVK